MQDGLVVHVGRRTGVVRDHRHTVADLGRLGAGGHVDVAVLLVQGVDRCLRVLDELVEKKRGVFYFRSRSFLHFHEDPKGMFADIRQPNGEDFDRIDVTQDAGRAALLEAARQRVGA